MIRSVPTVNIAFVFFKRSASKWYVVYVFFFRFVEGMEGTTVTNRDDLPTYVELTN